MQIKKRFVVVAGLAVVGSFGLAGPSFAGNAGGGTGYGTQPGFSTAQSNSNGCAGHGAFGAFGTDYNFGNSTSGHLPEPGNATNGNGADGQATGSNNASLCGNPQGNP